MLRDALFCLCVFSPVAFSQALAPNLSFTPGSPVQVLYVADATNLYTNNIDPQTFEPSLMGTIPLPKPQVNGLAVSADGRFLYLMASDPYPATDNRIYVYDTTGYGVPGMPVQSVTAPAESSMTVDPTTKFLYAVHMGARGTNNGAWAIYRYEINGQMERSVIWSMKLLTSCRIREWTTAASPLPG